MCNIEHVAKAFPQSFALEIYCSILPHTHPIKLRGELQQNEEERPARILPMPYDREIIIVKINQTNKLKM